jgi:hypothetical protein
MSATASSAVLVVGVDDAQKLFISGLDGRVFLERSDALAVASQLIKLAQHVEPPRTIRRVAGTDEHLRDLDQ